MLSLNIYLNQTIIKSLILSPLREIYIDYNFPSEIHTERNSLLVNLIRFQYDKFYLCIPKFFGGKIFLNNKFNSLQEIKKINFVREFNNEILIEIDKIKILKLYSDDFIIEFSEINQSNIFHNINKNNIFDIFPHLFITTLSIILIIILFFSISPNANLFNLNKFESSNAFATAVIQPDKEKELIDLKNDFKNNSVTNGKKHKYDEGKMGEKQSQNLNGKYAIKGDIKNQDINLSRDKAIESALDTSIIKYLNGNGSNGSPFRSVFSDIENGNRPEDILGGLYGNEFKESNGYDSIGLKGTGIGENGDGDKTIGLGNDNTIGKNSNNPDYGKDINNFGNRKASVPDPLNGIAEIKGSLDKEIIRRVIKRNINQIKYCYDFELQKDPSLSGRLKIKFIIDQNGTVISSFPTGLGVSHSIDLCVANKIKQLSFPMPENGGIVEVTYPFLFQSSAE